MGMRIICGPKWLIEGLKREQPQRERLPDCKELGPVMREQSTRRCSVKKRHCAIHDVCTTLTKLADVACCADCPDHTERLDRNQPVDSGT